MWRFSDASRTDYFLAAVSGLLLTLSFPRYGNPLIAWVALLPLLRVTANNKPATCFILGWFAGICHGLSLLYWITYVVNHYGNLSLFVSLGLCFLLVSYLAIFPGLFCAGLGWMRKRHLPWPAFAPFLWVALEMGKSRLLTGFPWENLGYSQYRWLPIIQVADIAGVYGISFILVFFNILIYYLIFDSARNQLPIRRFFPLIVAIGLVLTLYGYGRWRLASMEAGSRALFDVALVQGNIAQDTKWDPAFQQSTLERYVRLSRQVVEQETDLVVWPETATPFYFQNDLKNSKHLAGEVIRLKKPLLFGSPAYLNKEGGPRFYNRAYLLNHRARVIGYYDKIHLVPFGEYVPLKSVLFFVHKLVQAAGDFASGIRADPLHLPPAKLGVLICYEAIFPELSRNLVGAGANLLINITNDAWFGRSSAPYQHLSMTVFRAVENRVPIARCANTGISAFIDIGGNVLQATDVFEEATLHGTLRLGQGRTVYCQYGDWFAWCCVVISLLGLGYSLSRSNA